MGKRKRFHLLSWLLALCLLTACAGSASVTDGAQRQGGLSADADAQSPQAAAPSIPIAFWFAGGHTALSVMREIVDSFNRSQNIYAVEMSAFENFPELYRAALAAIATGTAPDVVTLERDASRELSWKGLTVDLTRTFERDEQFNPERFLSVYYNQGLSDDGRLFAMPLYGTMQVMYYNKAAFAAAGVDPASVRTWKALADAAKKIRDAGLCEYGWEPERACQPVAADGTGRK